LLYVEPALPAGDGAPFTVPQIDAAQLAAYVFTSGSSGAPLPHAKSWGRLVQCVRAEVTRLPMSGLEGCAVLGTCRRSTCTALSPACCCHCRAQRAVRRAPVLPG